MMDGDCLTRGARTGTKRYVCGAEDCGQAFGKQSELVKHRREAHSAAVASDSTAAAEGPATKGEFACTTCGRTFTRKSGLTQHLRVHEADSTQPLFTCDKCGCSYTKVRGTRTRTRTRTRRRC
jgi:protein-arginine kinase activator protein McsA